MARIRASNEGRATRVVLSGRLTAADMGRLEQACAPALIAPGPDLQLDVHGVTSLDSTARAVLQRMVSRGASIMPRAQRETLLNEPEEVDGEDTDRRDGADADGGHAAGRADAGVRVARAGRAARHADD